MILKYLMEIFSRYWSAYKRIGSILECSKTIMWDYSPTNEKSVLEAVAYAEMFY